MNIYIYILYTYYMYTVYTVYYACVFICVYI